MTRRTVSTVSAALLALVTSLGAVLPGTTDIASAASAASAAPAVSPSASRMTLTTAQFERRVLARVNARRTKVGCAKLRANAPLVRAARRHSARMAAAQNLSHRLPREAALATRVVKAGYGRWAALAENIAWGPTTPARIFALWVHSAPHRANLDRCVYRDVGIGVTYRGGHPWVTLDLGRRR